MTAVRDIAELYKAYARYFYQYQTFIYTAFIKIYLYNRAAFQPYIIIALIALRGKKKSSVPPLQFVGKYDIIIV